MSINANLVAHVDSTALDALRLLKSDFAETHSIKRCTAAVLKAALVEHAKLKGLME